MDWLPNRDAVKALIPQRTRGQPFDATTIPTAADVDETITQIGDELVGDVGTIPADDELRNYARRVVALGAAAQIELALWPEQSYNDSSVGQVLYSKYRTGVERLRALLEARDPKRGPFSGSIALPRARTSLSRHLDATERA